MAVSAVLAGFALTAQQAQAGTLYKGWNYSIDSANDGTEYSKIGSKSAFEFYGMAMKQTRDKVYFAFNSNLSLANGFADKSTAKYAKGGSIRYGDMMLDFTGKSFSQAQGSLYSVHFDSGNDGTLKAGLYSNVTATSVSTQNMGYRSLQQHTNQVAKLGGKASYGDLDANTTYFDSSQASANIIKSGSYLGGIDMITDFSKLGLDFSHFGATGSQLFGFSIDRALLPQDGGNFTASLFAECGNDGIVLNGSLQAVPEPTAIVGLAAVGLLAARKRRQQRAA